MEQAYHLIDLFVWNLGAPEQVYSLNTNRCSKKSLPPYLTEDTAMLSMKFADGIMGNLLTSWMSGPAGESISFHGTDGTMVAGIDHLNVYDSRGRLVMEQSYHIDQQWSIAQQLRHFAGSLLDEEVKPVSVAGEHLANVAVIESAYLSARTQLPETLKVYGPAIEL